jgi:hypothetical protein
VNRFIKAVMEEKQQVMLNYNAELLRRKEVIEK